MSRILAGPCVISVEIVDESLLAPRPTAAGPLVATRAPPRSGRSRMSNLEPVLLPPCARRRPSARSGSMTFPLPSLRSLITEVARSPGGLGEIRNNLVEDMKDGMSEDLGLHPDRIARCAPYPSSRTRRMDQSTRSATLPMIIWVLQVGPTVRSGESLPPAELLPRS